MIRILLLSVLLLMGCVSSETPALTDPNLSVNEKVTALGYIIQYNDSVSDVKGQTQKILKKYNARAKHEYNTVIKGFSAELSDVDVAELRQSPSILRIEADGIVSISTDTTVVATGLWGLDRINQRTLPLDGMFSYSSDPVDVRIYIMDTGVLTTHDEFSSRILTGYSALVDPSYLDCNGHGTHVAGTAAGSTTGVARRALIVPVRVIDCNGSGTWSGIIAGIDWVTQQKNNNPLVPMVANMSVGGGYNMTVTDAINRSISAGVVYVVAAGNSGADACSYTPSSTPQAITVASVNSNDTRSSWSNYGSCVDIFGPGESIFSSYLGGNSSYATLSGTSMSSPHVTGVVALMLSKNPTYNAAQIASALTDSATKNIIIDAGTGSPNSLLYTFTGRSIIQPPVENIVFSVTKQSNRKKLSAQLKWSGAIGSNVTIYKNNVVLAVTPNDGAYADSAVQRGVTYVYKICTSTCSQQITVSF